MVEQAAAIDPYISRFLATITGIEGRDIILDRTYFYAESGGQPADRGTIAGIQIETVHTDEMTTSHRLVDGEQLSSGDRVVCEIDQSFRSYCMRAHTASHVLYGAARPLLDDLGYGGFDIGPEKVRIDFETTSTIDDELILSLQRRANMAVWESRPVHWTTVPVSTALDDDSLAFNVQTENAIFNEDDHVRVVTIGPSSIDDDGSVWDIAACGGTHVRNTREIGSIEVLGRSNPGEGMTRIEFTVGPSAIDHRYEIDSAAMATAERMDVTIDQLPTSIDRLQSTLESRTADLESMTDRVIRHAFSDASSITGQSLTSTLRFITVEDLPVDRVTQHARDIVGEDAAALVVVVDSDPSTIIVATDGSRDASAIVASITGEFGGGGGGSDTTAQGGGVHATPDELVNWLQAGSWTNHIT